MSAAVLSSRQLAALRDLGEPYHYRVNWRPKLTKAEHNDLRQRELITEAWTWASTTRPDTAITSAGDAARTA